MGLYGNGGGGAYLKGKEGLIYLPKFGTILNFKQPEDGISSP